MAALRLALLGLGQMGAPIARNLVAAGFPVTVWNRHPRPGLVPGAHEAESIAEAVHAADIAVSVLANDAAVRQVVLGTGGVIEHLRDGGIHLGLGTISLALATELAAAHADERQHYVAAPVFGRPDAAAERGLWLVPGGDAGAVAACQPVFDAIGRGTFPMASAPHAHLAKLVGNFLLVSMIEALAEGLALGEKGGIDPERLLAMLTGTLLGAPAVERYGRMIATTQFEPAGFPLHLGLKDLRLMLAAADALEAPLPFAELAHARVREAIDQGRAGLDWAGLATVARESAGLPPVRG